MIHDDDTKRRLRDKYIDKYGYTKKIVIDDVIDQFVGVHQNDDKPPSSTDFKQLDIVIKKRIMGKDITYTRSDESAGPGMASNSRIKRAASEILNNNSSSLKQNQNSQNKKQAPTKQQGAVQLDTHKVTGKITQMNAPVIQQKATSTTGLNKNKSTISSTASHHTINQVSKGDPVQPVDAILGLEPSVASSVGNDGSKNKSKRPQNKWGIIEVYRSKQYEQDMNNLKQKKIETSKEYKKELDDQMDAHHQIKKLQDIQKTASDIKLYGNKNSVDQEELLKQYNEIQDSIQKRNIVSNRDLEKYKLQNNMSSYKVNIGTPLRSQEQKQQDANQYKSTLDRQIQEKQNIKQVESKDNEYYKQLYSDQNNAHSNNLRDSMMKKKQQSVDYYNLLTQQIDYKNKHSAAIRNNEDMNENEYKINKDILSNASRII